jgi:hypothetical protein
MQVRQPLEAVESAARNLKLKHRKQAFEFSAEAALADNGLTEKKKKTLHTLATKLALDNEFVEHKLANIQSKAG